VFRLIPRAQSPRAWHSSGRFTFDFVHPAALIEATSDFYEYPNCDRDPLPRWSFDRVTLQVALGPDPGAAVSRLQAGDDAVAPWLVSGDGHPSMEPPAPQPLHGGAVEDAQKPAAVDADLRRVETGLEPAQVAPDGLAAACLVDQLADADAGTVERGQQAQAV
jgi:hypothetical protein